MANPGKQFMRPHLNEELGAVVHTCHPSYEGGQEGKIVVLGQPW
jgi:hypothetical protein